MRVARSYLPLARLVLALAPAAVWAQGAEHAHAVLVGDTAVGAPINPPPPALSVDGTTPPGALETPLPPTREDSLAMAAARDGAARDQGLRLIISITDRRLMAVDGGDTLLAAPAAVGMDARLEYEGRVWIFKTPRGERIVRAKAADPVWVPPDWHYAEVARAHGLRLAALLPDRPVVLADGSVLELRDGQAGVVHHDFGFAVLPTDEEIVFDGTLFIPPIGTLNRRIEGELGAFQLDLGDGYLVHGTPHESTIGRAATHGCVRLRVDDIAWLYEHIPVGTRVYIY